MKVTYHGMLSPMRDRVFRLEAEVRKLPQVDCPVRNIFAPGIYAREMTIPKGVTATGAVHKTEHLSIITSGHCLLTTDDGVKELRAGALSVTKPGMKRAIFAIEDTVMITIHPNVDNEKDVSKLVEILTESKASELLGGSENRQLLEARVCLSE